MAIKGSLKEASLPDVIQLLYLGRRTGCLALADRHNFGTIYLDEGQIVYASIVNWRDKSLRKIAAPFNTPKRTTD